MILERDRGGGGYLDPNDEIFKGVQIGDCREYYWRKLMDDRTNYSNKVP